MWLIELKIYVGFGAREYSTLGTYMVWGGVEGQLKMERELWYDKKNCLVIALLVM